MKSTAQCGQRRKIVGSRGQRVQGLQGAVQHFACFGQKDGADFLLFAPFTSFAVCHMAGRQDGSVGRQSRTIDRVGHKRAGRGLQAAARGLGQQSPRRFLRNRLRRLKIGAGRALRRRTLTAHARLEFGQRLVKYKQVLGHGGLVCQHVDQQTHGAQAVDELGDKRAGRMQGSFGQGKEPLHTFAHAQCRQGCLV